MSKKNGNGNGHEADAKSLKSQLLSLFDTVDALDSEAAAVLAAVAKIEEKRATVIEQIVTLAGGQRKFKRNGVEVTARRRKDGTKQWYFASENEKPAALEV